MDILVSSNLERLLYLMSGCDTDLVSSLMEQLNRDGSYTVPEKLLTEIQSVFWAGCCDDAGAQAAISSVGKQHHYLCDPHTATGWAVAEDYVNQTGDKTPMVVLSTASAYKFPAAVLGALSMTPAEDEFDQMEQLKACTGTQIPKNLADLRHKEEKHKGCIPKDEMLTFVKGL
jgi:threonine synthase